MNKKYTLALIALCSMGGTYAQSLTQAKQWFEEGKFAEAKPVFQKLVKQAPSNANYNFWYGACCYETGELQESQPYLEKSAARKVINAYLYLGKLYYTMYRFDEATENIEEHIQWLEKKKRDTSAAEKELDRCRQAARMLRGTENVAVIDSFVVDKNNFLSAYKLSKESGNISLTEDGSGTSFTNELGDKMIFTQASEDGETSLYSRFKLIDKWEDAKPLSGLDESGHNQNYPFMASDGITLYFGAEGDESMGGYDIFVTRYDSDDNTYLRPDNIGMPFNSPYNDYMYALDDLNNLGWFASDRYQPEGKVCIYVFVPNSTKQVYDYETTDQQTIIDAATLKEIKKTWSDPDKVRIARQHLAQVLYSGNTEKKKGDFRFVVDDNAVYHTLSDFRSKEARQMYASFLQKEKDLASLEESLTNLRAAYQQSNKAGKEKMAPGILDKEKRTNELRHELEQLTLSVRNAELKALKQ
mgnify:FL=1